MEFSPFLGNRTVSTIDTAVKKSIKALLMILLKISLAIFERQTKQKK